MSLEDKLAALRAAAAERIPPEKRAVMGQATKELRASGIMDSVIKVGDPLPPFALANADGADVFSDDLLAKGAVVLTVFRGHW
jgi:hypothetical protein